jgi:hypothetical protein
MADKENEPQKELPLDNQQVDDADISDFDDAAAGVGSPPAAAPAQDDASTAAAEQPDGKQAEEEIDPEILKAIAADDESPAAAATDDDRMIPKARFDEVNGKFKDVASRLDAIEADRKQAQAKAAPGRDFDAEEKELEAKQKDLEDKFESGEIDADAHRAQAADYVKQLRQLDRERGHAEGLGTGLQEADKRVAKERQEAAQKAWQAKIGAWEKANADKLENAAYKDKVEELFTKFGKDPSLSDDDLIAKVEEGAQAWVSQMAKLLGLGEKTPVADPDAVPAADPHAARNAKDATAQARASALPSASVPGSAGNRSTRGAIPGKVQDLTQKEIDGLLKEDGAAKDIADF